MPPSVFDTGSSHTARRRRRAAPIAGEEVRDTGLDPHDVGRLVAPRRVQNSPDCCSTRRTNRPSTRSARRRGRCRQEPRVAPVVSDDDVKDGVVLDPRGQSRRRRGRAGTRSPQPGADVVVGRNCVIRHRVVAAAAGLTIGQQEHTDAVVPGFVVGYRRLPGVPDQDTQGIVPGAVVPDHGVRVQRVTDVDACVVAAADSTAGEHRANPVGGARRRRRCCRSPRRPTPSDSRCRTRTRRPLRSRRF